MGVVGVGVEPRQSSQPQNERHTHTTVCFVCSLFSFAHSLAACCIRFEHLKHAAVVKQRRLLGVIKQRVFYDWLPSAASRRRQGVELVVVRKDGTCLLLLLLLLLLQQLLVLLLVELVLVLVLVLVPTTRTAIATDVRSAANPKPSNSKRVVVQHATPHA